MELIIRLAEYKPNYFSVMNSTTRVYFFKKKEEVFRHKEVPKNASSISVTEIDIYVYRCILK